MRLIVLLAALTSLAAAAADSQVGEACQPCRSSSSCQALSAPVTRQLQTQNLLPWGTSIAETACHSGLCVPEAAEERDSFCARLQGRLAAQPQAESLQQVVLRKGSADVQTQQGSQEKRRLLHEQGQNATEGSTSSSSTVGTGISAQGSSSAADGAAYLPAPVANLNVADMAAWASGGASPSPVAMPVSPPTEPVLTPSGSPADAAGSSPVVVVTAASTQEQPAAYHAQAPANATNSTDGGVSSDAGPQPGADVGGVSYGGGLITQSYGSGGGGGGGGGSAGQAAVLTGGSPVFPGGVQSFQATGGSGVLDTASPSPEAEVVMSPRPHRPTAPAASPPPTRDPLFTSWIDNNPTVLSGALPPDTAESAASANTYLRAVSGRDSLLQTDDGTPSFFQPAAASTPKANVLAYGKGYVELKGQTIQVIPHVMNLESCARHCDADAQCTHWRRCAGGDCGARLQECELMSGPVSGAPGAPATDGGSGGERTVAPTILQQHTPSIRYIDPSQSNVIMESGTKSPNEFPNALYGCPYPAVPNGQLGQCIPPPQCNCANGVCYGSC